MKPLNVVTSRALHVRHGLPRISIVVPSYNQVQYLDEAITSVLSQNYPDLEVMVFDGASSDGSPEVIRRHSSALTYWQSRPDGGQTAAIIDGFARSTGSLIGWLNSDDVLLPGALWKIADAYRRRPNASLIGGNFLLIDAHGYVIRCKRHPRNASWWARAGLLTVNQPGSFFSREAYARVGGLRPDLDYVMDTEFYVRLLSTAGTSYVYVNDWLAGFRLHATNKTNLTALRDGEHAKALSRYPIGSRRILTRSVWTGVYRAHQLVNGNYLRMAVETWRARGRHWQRWTPKLNRLSPSL